jgi:hypothetical protein
MNKTKTFTKEQRADYYKNLRARWTANKAAAAQDTDAAARYAAIMAETPDYKISYAGFYFTYSEMKRQGLDGIPYVDAKTFQGWRASGYQVTKGSKSMLAGITWIATTGTGKSEAINNDSDSTRLYPKQYALFHRTQVEEIEPSR